MNVEKINDFIDVWADSINLKDKQYIDLVKEDIIKRCKMYEKIFPEIKVDEDECSQYIIKPVNGKYSLDDFLLNRLLNGIREFDYKGSSEDTNWADYDSYRRKLSVDINLITTEVEKVQKKYNILVGKQKDIANKSVEHELGHCLKTRFDNGYNTHNTTLNERYTILINNLQSYKNGIYKDSINDVEDIKNKHYSNKTKVGIRKKGHYTYNLEAMDETLNEVEALDLNNNEVEDIWPLSDNERKSTNSGNYINVYNFMSGYKHSTGYGKILKSLLGEKESFIAEYIDPAKVFLEFDKEYAEIANEIFGLDGENTTASIYISNEFKNLNDMRSYNENIMLKLDEFFAKCYEKKISKLLENNNGQLTQEQKEAILSEINEFSQRMTFNKDEEKNNSLKHNIIFNNIKSRMNQLEREQVSEKSRNDTQERMQFVQRFLDLYDNTETEYQQETRLELETGSIQRVLDIVGKKDMQISDLIDVRYIDIDETGENRPEYTAKQFSAMARLLKAAEGLNNDKDVNPNGVNYLEQFTAVPQIKNILLAMSQDFKYEGTYLHQLRDEYKKSESVGDISDLSSLEEVSDDDTTVSHKLNKTMGTTYEQRTEQQTKTASQSFRDSVSSRTSRSIPQKAQPNKTPSQSFRESVSQETTKQGISEEREQQTKTASQKFRDRMEKLRSDKKTGMTDVKKSQEDIGLRKERGILIRQNLFGQLDEDGKRRLEEINRLLNIKNVNVQQFEANKRRQGQSR